MIKWHCSGAVNINQLCRTSMAMVLLYKLQCSAQLKLVIVQCQASWFEIWVWFPRAQKTSDNQFWWKKKKVHPWSMNQGGLKWAVKNVLDLELPPEMRLPYFWQILFKSVADPPLICSFAFHVFSYPQSNVVQAGSRWSSRWITRRSIVVA